MKLRETLFINTYLLEPRQRKIQVVIRSADGNDDNIA